MDLLLHLLAQSTSQFYSYNVRYCTLTITGKIDGKGFVCAIEKMKRFSANGQAELYINSTLP